ncbi:MAG: DUF5009 domain-containing protein [Paludibacter sp.]|jgi:predicted acyltransferase|nr:DUF5009 domain-containing protein [Paludibacter sp.]
MEKSQRLLALDVLRGITIAGMIMVNNPGSWGFVYTPLQHASWNGLTPTDLVFPFFMFIMGISVYLSYQKFDFQFSGATFFKLLRRSVLLFLIGIGLGWLSLSMRQWNSLRTEELDFFSRLLQSVSAFDQIRILGVLQRLALVSFFGTLIVLTVKQKLIPWLVALLLFGYWALIAFTGSYEMSPDSIVAIIDRALLGESHMYRDTMADGTRIAFDPEGVLSTIPGIAHVLLGFLTGKLMTGQKEVKDKLVALFAAGALMMFAGMLMHYGFPINKKIWSSSFVLTTCGMGALLLGLLVYVIDMKSHKRWSVLFESFGINPMILYVTGSLLGILLGNIGFMYANEWISLKSFAYTHFYQAYLGDYPGSLAFALTLVGICWLLAHYLYKKRIFIKL